MLTRGKSPRVLTGKNTMTGVEARDCSQAQNLGRLRPAQRPGSAWISGVQGQEALAQQPSQRACMLPG